MIKKVRSAVVSMAKMIEVPEKIDCLDMKIGDLREDLTNLHKSFIPRGECDKCHEGFSSRLDTIVELIKKNNKTV